MAERRKRGLGRGLGALIPDAASSDRPVDVFFSGGEREEVQQDTDEPKAQRAARTDPAASMQSSRRRKPQSGSSAAKNSKQDAPSAISPASKSTGSKAGAAKTSTAKTSTAKTTGAKDQPAEIGSAKKTTTGTSTKADASQTAMKKDVATSEPAASRSTSSTPQRAKTPAAATGTKKKTEATKTAARKSAADITAGSQTAETKTAPNTVTATAATSGKEARETSSANKPNTSAKKTTSEFNPAADGPVGDGYSSPPSTPVDISSEPDFVSRRGAASSSGVASEVEAAAGSSDVDPGDWQDDRSIDESDQADDVTENHPGVYTSRHEVFDEARDSGDTESSDTTYEVTGKSASPDVSSNSGPNANNDSASDRQSDLEGVDSIPDTEFGEIDVDRIDANPRQPRTFFDEDQLSELVHSIREIGVLQPVVVRQKPGDSERFELIMGERRLRATKDAGLASIPAIIRYVDDTDLLRDALLENLHRAELNPLEEAAAYGQLLEDFGCTQEELSERIGRSRPQISNTLRLLRLPPLVQRRVAAGVISAGHARAILGLREAEHMEVLAQRIVAEGLSVRASEEAVVLLNRGDSMNVSRATTRVAPQFIEVAERLGDRLDTKVNITVGKKKGKLSVEFANQDDLDRILHLLGVESADG